MVALLVNFLSWVNSNLFRNTAFTSTECHISFIPSPPIIHKILEEDFVEKFDNILIIGDVHGCYDEMQDLLAKVKETLGDSSTLKLFVGDLVNKGPKSKKVIEFFLNEGKEDSFAVRGNHDELVIEKYLFYKKNPDGLTKNFQWISSLSDDEIDFLINLPYTISISSLNSIIVHAGLVPGKHLSLNKCSDMVSMRNIVYEDYFDGEGIKGIKSTDMGEPWIHAWKGPQMVYFGHDAKRGLQKTNYACGLDTGCVYGGKLTGIFIKGIKNKELIQVQSRKMYVVPETSKNTSDTNKK